MIESQELDPLLRNYFHRSLDILSSAGSEALVELTIRPLRRSVATLRATLRFKESSHLFVWMRAGMFSDEPWLLRYSFHYMTNEGTTIFRYDNSDHHRGLEHHPNHKHEGANERVIDCPQPSIRAIRDEIVAYLNNLSRSSD